MLSAEEITVGHFAMAQPGSLILPRPQYEAVVAIEQSEQEPVAVFLEGQHRYQSFSSADNTHWKGLIIPAVRFEVDASSLFDPDVAGHVPGGDCQSIVKTRWLRPSVAGVLGVQVPAP